MASSKTIFSNLVIPLFLLFISTLFEITGVHGNILCIEQERVALLKIKKSLNDSSGRLSSWVGQDCCKWKGVVCNSITGHVVELDLHRCSICTTGELFLGSLRGMIPSQLGNLSNLHILGLSSATLYVLDLSWLSGLTSLQYLFMSYVNMSKVSDNWLYNVNTIPSLLELHLLQCGLGTLPQTLPPVNFTSLAILDLSFNDFTTIPRWIFNISNLVSLKVLGSKLRGPFPVVGWRNLCKLQSLNLAVNELTGEVNEVIMTLSLGNNKSLENVDLSSNHLSGLLPEHLGQFHSLKHLNVFFNSISGPIPLSIGNLSNLETLVLSGNMMNGTIPESIGQLTKLSSLHLFGNSWEGTITNIHFQNLTNLAAFSISCAKHNLGFFNVTQDWAPPFNLSSIEIQDCQIGPKFPSWLETQKELGNVLLTNVGISEPIPDWLWNLSPQIISLNLSHNKIDGHLPRTMNFLNDSSVILAFNQLEGPIPLWYGVGHLDLRNNSLFGPIPTNYFQEMTSLYILDLSNNLLNGSIPSSIPIQLQLLYLGLSYNQLTGEIPVNLMRMQSLAGIDFSHNNLSGGIPTSLCSIPSLNFLQLSNNNLHQDLSSALKNCTGLTFLDLGNNRFLGSIPQEIGKSLAKFSVLRLRGNALTGSISESLCNLPNLHILDLAENNLYGIIPTCLGDVLGLKLQSTESCDSILLIGNHIEYNAYNEHIDLVLKGRQDEYFQLMKLVNMIDLSKNHLSGIIPEKLTELLHLDTLNLSWNHFTGDIPKNMGSLRYLETLDLSHNHLSGPIPPSMSSMTLLGHLNLSYNNFSGQIPSTNQFLTFNDPSIYEGNPNLCGAPLSNCSSPNAGEADEDENEEKLEKFWFYVGIGFGFIVGFWAVFGSLVIKRSWRHAYFKFLDNIKNKLWG